MFSTVGCITLCSTVLQLLLLFQAILDDSWTGIGKRLDWTLLHLSEVDPWERIPPTTFRLWQVRKWEWENGKKNDRAGGVGGVSQGSWRPRYWTGFLLSRASRFSLHLDEGGGYPSLETVRGHKQKGGEERGQPGAFKNIWSLKQMCERSRLSGEVLLLTDPSAGRDFLNEDRVLEWWGWLKLSKHEDIEVTWPRCWCHHIKKKKKQYI